MHAYVPVHVHVPIHPRKKYQVGDSATIGLVTSESPDAVATWRGKKQLRLYGKPILACDKSSRVLVLREPIYMMWPEWMQWVEPGNQCSISASISDLQTGEHDNYVPIASDRRDSCPSKQKRISIAARPEEGVCEQ
ncbi:hypothetical protein ACOMHN_044078 [Nucella lapillus]